MMDVNALRKKITEMIKPEPNIYRGEHLWNAAMKEVLGLLSMLHIFDIPQETAGETVAWQYDMDTMFDNLAEVAFTDGMSVTVHICTRYLLKGLDAYDRPIPKDKLEYGYNDSTGRQIDTSHWRAYAWRSIAAPPPKEPRAIPTAAPTDYCRDCNGVGIAPDRGSKGVRCKCQDNAPTDNTALVGTLKRRLQYLLLNPKRDGYGLSYDAGHDDAVNDALAILSEVEAALQPAAPQPTPEVEALLESLRAKGNGPEANLWNAALDAVSAALARGSVADNGKVQAGDLNQGAPNRFDHTKRGFQP